MCTLIQGDNRLWISPKTCAERVCVLRIPEIYLVADRLVSVVMSEGQPGLKGD